MAEQSYCCLWVNFFFYIRRLGNLKRDERNVTLWNFCLWKMEVDRGLVCVAT
jgi:hypothetical protein